MADTSTQTFLRRALSSTSSASTVTEGGTFVSNHFGLFVFIIAASIGVVILIGVAFREHFWKKYRVDVCPGNFRRRNSGERGQDSQIARDHELAAELQRQLNEEAREEDRLEKRKERTEWYVSFLKPYTVVSLSSLYDNRLSQFGIILTMSMFGFLSRGDF